MDYLDKALRFNFLWYLIVFFLILSPFSIQSQSSLIHQQKRAKALINQRQFDSALEIYAQILAESEKAEDVDTYHNTITQQMLLYQRLNRYESAFKLVKEAISFYQFFPDTIHTKIGQLYSFQSNK